MNRSLPPRPPEGSRNLLEVEVTPTNKRVSQTAITAASIRRLRWKREGIHTHLHKIHSVQIVGSIIIGKDEFRGYTKMLWLFILVLH